MASATYKTVAGSSKTFSHCRRNAPNARRTSYKPSDLLKSETVPSDTMTKVAVVDQTMHRVVVLCSIFPAIDLKPHSEGEKARKRHPLDLLEPSTKGPFGEDPGTNL